MHFNPKIVTDGLAFMYDTGSVKSYKGEPTINYIHHKNAVPKDSYSTYSATPSGTYNDKHPNAIIAYNAAGSQMSGYYNSGVTLGELDATDTYHAHWQYDPILKKPVVVMNDIDGAWKAKWLSTGMDSWASYGKGHGDTYTISWLQWVDNLSKHAKAGLYRKRASDQARNFWDGQASSTTSYNTTLRTWQRVYHTFTTSSVVDLSSTYLSIYMYGQYSPRATVKVADVQFTWGDHPVQFCAEYERSATQGLLDLTKNETITLSNLSYDSNAQMSFDGTDDRFYITDPGVGTSFSIEVVIKVNSYSNGPLFVSPNSVGIDHYFRVNTNGTITAYFVEIPDSSGDGYTSTTTINTGEYYHVVISKTPSNGTLYVNGVAEDSHTPTLTAAAWSGDWFIGSRANNTFNLNGELPILKIYDRALTDVEILQNYNAIRGRYGI